ncbi:hypothetical protein [Novosphingobium lentum]|uniref:hypothetical protein n=1 Tax=Novosphingobium lentum TaxID=145287 RepID=UPI0012ED9B78|nr:hypothetical protein [Novosphingobium lentum]
MTDIGRIAGNRAEKPIEPFAIRAEEWILKQVRDDEIGLIWPLAMVSAQTIAPKQRVR